MLKMSLSSSCPLLRSSESTTVEVACSQSCFRLSSGFAWCCLCATCCLSVDFLCALESRCFSNVTLATLYCSFSCANRGGEWRCLFCFLGFLRLRTARFVQEQFSLLAGLVLQYWVHLIDISSSYPIWFESALTAEGRRQILRLLTGFCHRMNWTNWWMFRWARRLALPRHFQQRLSSLTSWICPTSRSLDHLNLAWLRFCHLIKVIIRSRPYSMTIRE